MSQRLDPRSDECLHVDVLIVGAGLSGIGAACHLRRTRPTRSYAILEARDAIGGTWDLFRYPGIRSDSDMYTLGYPFRPWTGDKSHRRRAVDPGVRPRDRRRARHRPTHPLRAPRRPRRVVDRRRALDRRRPSTAGEMVRFTAGFLLCCSGYYRYDEGYTPDFAGIERFAGQVVHPQHWPDDLDYAGKRVVVIGSGATAVTLVPAMAAGRRARDDAAALADATSCRCRREDPVARGLRRVLPDRARVRRRAVRRTCCCRPRSYQLSRRRPALVQERAAAGGEAAAAGGLRGRHPLHAALQPVGPAAVPGAGRRPVPGDQRGPPRSSPTGSRPFTETASGWSRGRSWPPTW